MAIESAMDTAVDVGAIDDILAEIEAFSLKLNEINSDDEDEGLEQVGGGDPGTGNSSNVGVQRREKPHPPRTDAHRFSRANLEDSGDVELDAILGELCALETQFEFEITSKNSTSESSLAPSPLRTSLQSTTPGILDKMQPKSAVQGVPVVGTAAQQQQPLRPSHSRSNSGTRNKFNPDPRDTDVDISTTTIVRTDSPDNDSAFSDNVSMLSSESSASSGASGGAGGNRRDPNKHSSQAEQAAKMKAEKIKMALEKIKEANVKKLFIKAFTSDGSTKSLLVDEKMTISLVTRLLADKNHVRMDPKWAIIEHIPDLYMERIYEDDEMLVENLLLWTRDSKNKLIFVERPDKYDLFLRPEHYLLVGSFSQKNEDLDDEARGTLIEEFFSSTGCGVPEVEGALFLKSEGKKVWKKYYFVLRASGLYYCPKGKSSRSSRDLVCLTTLEVNQVYYGVGWKKKYKAPSDHCFAIKHPHLQAKSSKYIKYLCAEDSKTLTQWVMGIRIAKSGKRLRENYTTLVEDLAQEDIDMLASSRSFSIASMAGRSDLGSRGASQATTPSSESRSMDSCLAPSITQSAIDDDEGDDNISSAGSSSQDTPVNTLGRAPVWRQDSMKSGGSSSSSSGCLSERSSAGTPTGEHGFESDFPQGTIKRKPSSAPKLPLTSTTRLLVKEVDGEDVIDAASRSSTLRQSARRSLTEEVNTIRREKKRSSVTPSRISVTSNQSSNLSCNASIVSSNQSCNASIVSSNQSCNASIVSSSNQSCNASIVSSSQSCNISSVSSNQSCNVSIVSSSVSNVSSVSSLCSIAPQEEMVDNLPLPPPPLELSGTDAREMALLPPPPPELLASTLSLNSLPPPPEEADYPAVVDPEELMMASITSLPPPPPPSPPKLSSPTKGDLPPPPPTTPKPAPKTPPKPSSPIYGGVAPIYQTGSPIYQSGSSSPIYQSGRSTPIYQSGTSTPVYHSGPASPGYQSGTASPIYQISQNSHIYQTGGCSPIYGTNINHSGDAPIYGTNINHSGDAPIYGTNINHSGDAPIYGTNINHSGDAPIYGTNINHSGASPIYQAVTPPSVAPKPRRDSGNDSSIYSSPPYLQELRSVSVIAAAQQNGSWHQEHPQHPEIPLPPPPPPASAGEHPVYAQPQKSPQKKVKRITFQDDVQNIPPSPPSTLSKPPLPRRSESTRLSAMNPGRLDTPGCKVTPPKAFLNNLQRVMQKKWQVAQKCKDLDQKPHEVLGFRDPVLPSESEGNVAAWIQEHYGSLYENLSPMGTPQHQSVDSQDSVRQNSQTLKPAAAVPGHSEENFRLSQTTPCRKKPPPPPPKRSDSTQLSTRQ